MQRNGIIVSSTYALKAFGADIMQRSAIIVSRILALKAFGADIMKRSAIIVSYAISNSKGRSLIRHIMQPLKGRKN